MAMKSTIGDSLMVEVRPDADDIEALAAKAARVAELLTEAGELVRELSESTVDIELEVS